MTQKGDALYVHILKWPKDGSNLMLAPLAKTLVSSQGLNVQKSKVTQSASGIEIELPPENRDAVDSIIVLQMK